jgi:hypothetical protein
MMFAASARVAVTSRVAVTARVPASARMPVAETLAAAKVFRTVVSAAEMRPAARVFPLAGGLRKTITLGAARIPIPEAAALEASIVPAIGPHRTTVACARPASIALIGPSTKT